MNIFYFITARSYVKEEQKRARVKLNWLKVFNWHR